MAEQRITEEHFQNQNQEATRIFQAKKDVNLVRGPPPHFAIRDGLDLFIYHVNLKKSKFFKNLGRLA